MSNTTALESWGASKGADVVADDGEHAVAEHDITGEGVEHEHDEVVGDEALNGEGGDQVMDADAEAEATRLAAKKKKDMRTFMIAGIAAGVLIVGFVGFSIMKGSAARQQAQQEVAQQESPQQGQVDAGQGQLIAPVVQHPEAPGAIINERADGTPAAVAAPVAAPPAPDFGLQAQAPAASAPISAFAAAPVITAASASAVVAAPVATTVPTGLPLRAPVAPAPQVVAAPVPSSAEMDKLRAEVATLRSDLDEKTRALDGVRSELDGMKKAQAPRPAPAKVAAPRISAKKVVADAKPAAPVTGITETVVATAPAPIAAAAPAMTAATKAKAVRTDYRIYAVVDGRVYVMGPDGETVQIAARSPLADGSRVTNIDTDKNVVYTNAGEIR